MAYNRQITILWVLYNLEAELGPRGRFFQIFPSSCSLVSNVLHICHRAVPGFYPWSSCVGQSLPWCLHWNKLLLILISLSLSDALHAVHSSCSLARWVGPHAWRGPEKLRYFVQSLLLKEWPLLQRSNWHLRGQRRAAPATGFPFLYSSGATLGCKSLYSVCPYFVEMHGKQLPRSYSIALFFCFCEGSTMQLTSWEWPRAKSLLLNVTWARWQHTSEEEEQALGPFLRELPPEVSGTKHRWLTILKTQ